MNHHIVFASVISRGILNKPTSRDLRYCKPEISIYTENGKERICRTFSLYAKDSARLETNLYFDFDKERNAWTGNGLTKRQDFSDSKEIKKMILSLLFEIETSNLIPAKGNSLVHEHFYPTKL